MPYLDEIFPFHSILLILVVVMKLSSCAVDHMIYWVKLIRDVCRYNIKEDITGFSCSFNEMVISGIFWHYYIDKWAMNINGCIPHITPITPQTNNPVGGIPTKFLPTSTSRHTDIWHWSEAIFNGCLLCEIIWGND